MCDQSTNMKTSISLKILELPMHIISVHTYGVGSLPSSVTWSQFSHHTFPGQAVKKFTSTRCLHYRKKQLTSVHAKQWYSATNRSDMHCKKSNPGAKRSTIWANLAESAHCTFVIFLSIISFLLVESQELQIENK